MLVKYNILNVFITLVGSEYLYPKYADILTSPENSDSAYFGFSVQLQSSKEDYGRVIVGAPRANSTNLAQKDLIEPGAVYACEFETKNCEEYMFENKGNSDEEYYIDNKDYSSLGFSLDADDFTNGRLVACAPRWINQKTNLKVYKQNGMCYYLKDSSEILSNNAKRLMPFLNDDLQFESWDWMYILGQAGFSTHLIKDTNNIVITGLGLQNWTGSVTQYTLGQIEETHYVLTPKTLTLETYSYFGYSTLSGRFNSSDLNKRFYISGAPRSDHLTGRVFIYEELKDFKTFVKRYEFPGRQFGEYFGASLAVVDINGDKIDDIIIGAPMHSTEDQEEIGCIYTYITNVYNTKIGVTKNKMYLGDVKNSRFGSAISSVGDINKDGYEDIVVGAPYEDNGAVYLYLGQADHKGLKFDQKILASDFKTVNLNGFGYSLSRGVDIDSNYYNDIAVGAYLSGHVVVLKSRPIIKIDSNLKSSILQVDVNTKDFVSSVCLNYTGISVVSFLNVVVTVELVSPHVTFENNLNKFKKTIRLKKNVEYCEDIKIFVTEVLRDDILIIMSYQIIENNPENKFCKFCPKEETPPSPKTKIIPFASGCKDTICKSNLKVTANYVPTPNSLIIGSKEATEIHVSIENSGENSFDTKLLIEISLDDVQIQSENFCSQIKNNYTCNFRRPLLTNDKKDLIFMFNIENIDLSETFLKISMYVTSLSEDTDMSDNYFILEIPLTSDVKYNITSKSDPEQILLSENISNLHSITHSYNIESIGKTDLENLNLILDIPYKYNNKIIFNNIEITGCNNYEKEMFDITDNTFSNDLQKVTTLNCASSTNVHLKCKTFICEISDESEIKTAKIDINMDINLEVLKEDMETIYFVTHLVTDSQYLDISSFSITSLIFPPKAASITLYIVFGILGGLLLLLLVGFICYKVGFFKRNRPPRPEHETLLETNTNEDTTKNEMNEEKEINSKDNNSDLDMTKDESDYENNSTLYGIQVCPAESTENLKYNNDSNSVDKIQTGGLNPEVSNIKSEKAVSDDNINV